MSFESTSHLCSPVWWLQNCIVWLHSKIWFSPKWFSLLTPNLIHFPSYVEPEDCWFSGDLLRFNGCCGRKDVAGDGQVDLCFSSVFQASVRESLHYTVGISVLILFRYFPCMVSWMNHMTKYWVKFGHEGVKKWTPGPRLRFDTPYTQGHLSESISPNPWSTCFSDYQ